MQVTREVRSQPRLLGTGSGCPREAPARAHRRPLGCDERTLFFASLCTLGTLGRAQIAFRIKKGLKKDFSVWKTFTEEEQARAAEASGVRAAHLPWQAQCARPRDPPVIRWCPPRAGRRAGCSRGTGDDGEDRVKAPSRAREPGPRILKEPHLCACTPVKWAQATSHQERMENAWQEVGTERGQHMGTLTSQTRRASIAP